MKKVKIEDQWSLLRRIHPSQHVPDGNGGHRPSSAAFRDPDLSVDTLELLRQEGKDWRHAVEAFPSYGLVAFEAQAARALKQNVDHDPVEGNFAHTEVRGRKDRATQRGLASTTQWLKEPPR